jgi:glucose/arabinose dehydrogenase
MLYDRRMRNALQSLIAALCLLADAARAQNPLLELVTDEAQSPSFLADPGDGRLFISELGGRVRILLPNGHLQDPNDAFLDVSGSVEFGGAGEGGLHSIAFDPNFATNRRVFVEYTRIGSGTGVGQSPLETVIASYTAMAGDPNHVDPASAKVVLTQLSPANDASHDFSNHKGGQLQFGPDGMLYFAFGDGGSGNDPRCLAQTRGVLFGKMLRVDPNGTDPNHPNYGIPADNPFTGANDPNDEYRDEIWALGLRNPYRFSFDRQTGDLWVGDVGQDTREEIDMDQAPNAGRGKNYGWKVYEGNLCHFQNPGAAACPGYVAGCTSGGPVNPMYTSPVADFDHSAGGTVIGGYVYRGGTSAWRGRYIFADFIRGEIYALSGSDRVVLSNAVVSPVSFGEDHNGELYVLDLGNNTVSRLRFDLIGQSKQQDTCVSRLNDVFVKMATSKSSQVRSCVDKAASGKLMMGHTLDQCVADDPKDTFAKVRAKTEALDTDMCSALPPEFGYAGADAGLDAALATEIELAQDVLGDVLDAGVVPKATNKLAAACQKAVLGALASCQKTRRSEFVRCKKLGLKENTVGSSEGLAACLTLPNTKVAKACDPTTGKVATKAIASACTKKMVDLSTAFPVCNDDDPGVLATCLDHAGCLRNCELFNAADALGIDCAAACPP